MPLRTRCGTSRLPCMSLGVRAQGLGPRGGGTALAITICSVLPSVPYDAVGPPKFILLSRLNIQPARLPVNASPLLSRTTTHDSGPIWFATPSLGGTCTRETYRFVPAHRRVKELMRRPDSSVGGVRRAVPDSEVLACRAAFRSPPRFRSSPSVRRRRPADLISKNAILGDKVPVPREQLLVNQSCDVGQHSFGCIGGCHRRQRGSPSGPSQVN